MIPIILKALLLLIQVLSVLSLALVVTIVIGVRFWGWELNVAYKKEEESDD